MAGALLADLGHQTQGEPEKSVPMARGKGARIMNIFAEGGQFICLQTHFFGSAAAMILNSPH
jgi:hypothetical protein